MNGKGRDRSYIFLWRCLLSSPVFKRATLLQVWIYCLLRATHTRTEIPWNGSTLTLEPGQFIFGRHKAANDLGMPPSTLYDQMLQLREMGNIGIDSDRHCSVVTVIHWNEYQRDLDDVPAADPADGRQFAGTNKNVKNVKNYTRTHSTGHPPLERMPVDDGKGPTRTMLILHHRKNQAATCTDKPPAPPPHREDAGVKEVTP